MNELDQITPERSLSEVTQLVFSVVVRGLRAQQWRQSVHGQPGYEVCAWFGKDGLRCALGHLMECAPSFEKRFVVDCFYPTLRDWCKVNEPGPRTVADGEDPRFTTKVLEELRCAHDLSSSPEDMERRVRVIGVNYNLVWPEEETLDGNHNS